MSDGDFQKLEYDYNAFMDILFLISKKDYDYDFTLECNSSFLIDVSTDKEIVAFEILDASDFFETLTFKELQEANAEVTIKVNEDVIKLEIQLKNLVNNTPLVSTKTVKTINEDYVSTGIYNYKSITDKEDLKV